MMRKIKGKGVWSYDYAHDILHFRISGRKYEHSIEFDELVIDLDTEDFIMGMQLFDASKILNLPKTALKSIKGFEFYAHAEGKTITVRVRFTCTRRNKEIIQGQDFIREADIQEGEAVATA